jgi:hypothetical protein
VTTGGRYSSLLAEYLAAHLGRLRPQVTAVRGDERHGIGAVPPQASRNPKDPLPGRNPVR